MSTLVIQQPVVRQSPTPPPQGLTSLSPDTSRPNSAPIPNKHIPYCSPGPAPRSQQTPVTPPDSPPSKNSSLQTFSLLHPANPYLRIKDNPPIHSIDAFTLAAATDELAAQLLPEPKHVFPWLHGLHAENQVQLAFFIARRKALRNTPKCFRGITIIKTGGDLTKSRLKGAISSDEILSLDNEQDASFLDVDPREGFSVRNFQIQATKMALVSDVVVYGDSLVDPDEVYSLATKVSIAQDTWRVKNGYGADDQAPTFNTFCLSGMP